MLMIVCLIGCNSGLGVASLSMDFSLCNWLLNCCPLGSHRDCCKLHWFFGALESSCLLCCCCFVSTVDDGADGLGAGALCKVPCRASMRNLFWPGDVKFDEDSFSKSSLQIPVPVPAEIPEVSEPAGCITPTLEANRPVCSAVDSAETMPPNESGHDSDQALPIVYPDYGAEDPTAVTRAFSAAFSCWKRQAATGFENWGCTDVVYCTWSSGSVSPVGAEKELVGILLLLAVDCVDGDVQPSS
ncbi:hypothetical protein Nepgr_017391 [Nepenthes gracilis]|uniref:Uncharacterized protein n=1 Tax=Nepenthes gracilis TaxID=150966 RepID=A0AAD3SRC7_NEPGR|nr:hypothetical protein Nepgr_017391 [Nepenthes gracilis]